jgi:dTDP-4-dehydrorhamnose reductase
MKLLVIGSNGQLGQELMRLGPLRYPDIVGIDYPETDITAPDRLSSSFLDCQPTLVVNAAAYTNVDGAESEPELAMSVNCDGPANLARLSAEYQIPLIHLSTDYVFDGNQNIPYCETDPISPTGVYGRSKAAGESALRSIVPEHIILRTAWLYSPHGHNFVKTILRIAGKKPEISVVSDQIGCPTSAADLAEAILAIADRIQSADGIIWGTYHYCGQGITSWYDFACAIVQIGAQHDKKLTARVRPISSADYPSRAARPPYSALNCDRIRHNFGIVPKPWRDSLAITVGRLYRQAGDSLHG